MGKLSDLKSIYETYKTTLVKEFSISEPTDTLDIPSHQPTPSASTTVVIDQPPTQNDEECYTDSESNADMAKSEIFKILNSGNELMNLLQTKNIDVEPWQLSKLVKASDYVCSVKGSLQYDSFEKHCSDLNDGMSDLNSGMGIVGKIKDMLAGENLSVNEEVLKQVIFNIECLSESN